MALVNRWYEPRRFSQLPPDDTVLLWRVSVDGRAVLISRRTPLTVAARFVWARWHAWVMQGLYYPVVRTLEQMNVLVIPEGLMHGPADWRTFSVRESTIRERAQAVRKQASDWGYERGLSEAKHEVETARREGREEVLALFKQGLHRTKV
jgi:hypothetical protein